MASTKKKKKRKNRGQPASAAEAWPDLLTQGAQALDRNAAREAIALVKQALKCGAPSGEAAPLLFRAYLAREAQLRQKGMLREADAVRQLALDHQPSLDNMQAQDLLAVAPGLDTAGLLESYRAFLKNNPPAAAVDRHIAGRMLVHRQWHLLSGLDADLALKRDAQQAMPAAEDMHAGRWESALEQFKALPRSSPYAPAGLFCRAMTAFYAEDDAAVARAVDMLPTDFPLYPLARRLKESPEAIAPLWQGSLEPERRILALAEALGSERQGPIAQKLKDAAAALLPEDSAYACRHLLELINPLTSGAPKADSQWERIVRNVLDPKSAEMLLAKIAYYDFSSPLVRMTIYFRLLEKEFPRAGQARAARSLLILETLRRMENATSVVWVSTADVEMVCRAFNLPGKDLEEVKIGLNLAAIELDPDYREGYELLASWHPESRYAKNQAEKGFRLMCDRFPDDPFPLLELATLYYSKSAFRKAEAALAQALERAPHDRKVHERRFLSFLISAHHSLRRGKLDLARRDLDLALSQENAALRYLAVEKQILYLLEQQGQLSLFGRQADITPQKVKAVAEQALAPLSLFERLRALGHLALDAEQREGKWPRAAVAEVRKMLKRGMRRHAELTSEEIMALLRRPPRELEPLTGDGSLAQVYVKGAKRLLTGLHNADILRAFDLLLDAGCMDEVLAEIKRRKAVTQGETRCLLLFYEAVVGHLKHPWLDIPDTLHDIVSSAQPAWLESLRAAARRLSQLAEGFLRQCLADFDFSPRHAHPGDRPPDPFFDDGDGGGLFDEGNLAMMALMALVETLEQTRAQSADAAAAIFQSTLQRGMEAFVEKNELRRLPDDMLVMIRKDMARTDPLVSRLVSSVRKYATHETVEALSPEAWAFFFGKN